MTNQDILYRRWERGTRYYETTIQKDLFGWVVTRAWGSVGKRNGKIRNIPVRNVDAGIAYVQDVGRKRANRGYRPVF